MEIIPIESGPVDTIGYLVIDPIESKAIIIDAPYGSTNKFLTHLKEKNISLVAIVLTHTHWDHTADAYHIHNETNADVMVHKYDEYRLIEPEKHSIMPLPFKLLPLKPQKNINHKDIINCGNLSFEVLHTPGHTEGGICLVEHSKKIIFTGDTLFNESVGRVDLPGGSGEQLIDSIKRELLTLSDDYQIYCGHGNTSNIGYEKKNNPFLNGYFVI